MTYNAELYAQLHRGTPGDVDFYRKAVAKAAQILELGCGFGRILTVLARAGHEVTGLDIDADMLALTEQAQLERISTVHADMRNFQLNKNFDRVIIPYNSLYCMLSEAAVIDCLRCAGEHLNDKGKVVFDAYAIDEFHAQADPRDFNDTDDDNEPIESIRWQDTLYDVYETCTWDRASQGLNVSYRHEPRGGGSVLETAIEHRYILTSQLPDLCHQAGLQVSQLCEDFTGTPLTENAEHFTCIAQKI
jgi:SAM-dependent methyltransferase